MPLFTLKTDNSLWATNWNQYGQLGDGTTDNRSTPVQVATDVSKVKSTISHTLFLKTDGSLWSGGANDLGQLGDGTTEDRSTRSSCN